MLTSFILSTILRITAITEAITDLYAMPLSSKTVYNRPNKIHYVLLWSITSVLPFPSDSCSHLAVADTTVLQFYSLKKSPPGSVFPR